MNNTGLSKATLGRLPLYLKCLDGLPRGTANISSTVIARMLDLGEVQVRKDLAAICGTGRPRVGYDTGVLYQSIKDSLDSDGACEAVVVGAGRLGTALLEYPGFAEYGISVSKAFDIDKTKFSQSVRPLDELKQYCLSHQVEIGVIAVPAQAAHKTAELLVECGIKAIWCFASVKLDLPADIIVQYENLALSLAHLNHRIKSYN